LKNINEIILPKSSSESLSDDQEVPDPEECKMKLNRVKEDYQKKINAFCANLRVFQVIRQNGRNILTHNPRLSIELCVD
jgi:hypothetical protein